MKTTHTYMMKSHGSDKAVERKVTVEWPSIHEAIEKLGQERLEKILYGFIAAHHVQGRLKSALGAEKKSSEQLSLIQAVEKGETLVGLAFVPAERKAAQEKDPVVLRLMELEVAGELDAKVPELMKRWEIAGEPTDISLEELIEGYKAFIARQKEI